jgi:hypothetical protein
MSKHVEDKIVYSEISENDINKRSENSLDGDSPFHIAMKLNDNFTTAKNLISKGADVNVKNNDGRTALHSAAAFDKFEEVKFLLFNGANENIKDNDGNVPVLLYRSCKHAPYTEIASPYHDDNMWDLAEPYEYTQTNADANHELVRPSIWGKIDDDYKFQTAEDSPEDSPEDKYSLPGNCTSLNNSPTQILLDNYRKMKISFETCRSLNCPAFTKNQADKLKTHIRNSPQLEMVYREMRSKALMLSAFGISTDHKFFIQTKMLELIC